MGPRARVSAEDVAKSGASPFAQGRPGITVRALCFSAPPSCQRPCIRAPYRHRSGRDVVSPGSLGALPAGPPTRRLGQIHFSARLPRSPCRSSSQAGGNRSGCQGQPRGACATASSTLDRGRPRAHSRQSGSRCIAGQVWAPRLGQRFPPRSVDRLSGPRKRCCWVAVRPPRHGRALTPETADQEKRFQKLTRPPRTAVSLPGRAAHSQRTKGWAVEALQRACNGSDCACPAVSPR